jgi:hypothetical protein
MMNYNSYVNSLVDVLPPTMENARFLATVPIIIDYAEQRIYRDLDLLNTIVRDTGGNLTANSRNFTLPHTSGSFVVTESMNVFTPVGTTTNRNQLVPVSREFLDSIWANDAAITTPSVPTYYAMITDQIVIVGPPPDATYTMEVIGTIRPTPLSAANPTTYLTLYLPDLFLAASLSYAIGYQGNFTTTPPDQQQIMFWDGQYQKLSPSANTEEQRKRYASQAWTPKQPAPLATPPRV